jgi:hypothetical protein
VEKLGRTRACHRPVPRRRSPAPWPTRRHSRPRHAGTASCRRIPAPRQPHRRPTGRRPAVGAAGRGRPTTDPQPARRTAAIRMAMRVLRPLRAKLRLVKAPVGFAVTPATWTRRLLSQAAANEVTQLVESAGRRARLYGRDARTAIQSRVNDPGGGSRRVVR